MRVNRENLLQVLESLTPGLASKEILEQSSCLVFLEDGRCCTFNDEVFATRQSPLKLKGAVKAKPLLDLLLRLGDDNIDIDQTNGELEVKGKAAFRSGIRMEASVMLPVESVEMPKDWKPIPPEFSEAVGIVASCATTEESQFVLTCIHITSDFIEACDRFQIARYPVQTGISQPTLVRATSLQKIVGYSMTEMSETSSWVHFKNPAGLILSIRKYLDEYLDLDEFLVVDGLTPITLPGGIEEAVSRSEIFSIDSASGNHVRVDLKPDFMQIAGKGPSGWYKERKKVNYQGPPIQFLIAPHLLVEITKKSNECGVSANKLYVDGGKYRYCTSTKVPEEESRVVPVED